MRPQPIDAEFPTDARAHWPLALSICTTAYNEAGNVAAFLEGAARALQQLGLRGEILYIDDGSTDGTSKAVQDFAAAHPDVSIRLVRHATKRGITAAIEELVKLSQGELICLLPADLESSPGTDIPLLMQGLREDTEVVVGWRKGRQDGKVFASKVYNVLNHWLFKVRVHDANWIKLVRHSKIHGIRLRSDWHRFLLPILVANGCRVREVETPWNARSYGRSKFGLKRFPVSLADMLTVKFLLSYGARPLLFFGAVSFAALVFAAVCLGFAFTVSESALRLWAGLCVLAGSSLVVSLLACLIGFQTELSLGWEGLRWGADDEPVSRRTR